MATGSLKRRRMKMEWILYDAQHTKKNTYGGTWGNKNTGAWKTRGRDGDRAPPTADLSFWLICSRAFTHGVAFIAADARAPMAHRPWIPFQISVVSENLMIDLGRATWFQNQHTDNLLEGSHTLPRGLVRTLQHRLST